MSKAAENGLARQAYALTADLMVPRPGVYWTDLLLTAAVTYASLAAAILVRQPALAAAAALICLFALYRGVSFIHELTHLRPREVPGFRFGWNALVGVPFLAPSFMYEGVHNLHHAKDRYGTERDPEYLPLARYSPGKIVAFVAVALLAPLGVVLRFGVLTPLSFAIPRLRPWVVAKTSALTINPAFSREDLDAARRPDWLAQEIACWLWCWTLAAGVGSGLIPLRAVAIAAAILAGTTLVNQLRTACAHYWENDGEKMSFEAQFLDSVNVPPPTLLPMLWAPVGLRYHALHHLMPRLPYHALGEAHRRLVQAVPVGSTYRRVEERGLTPALHGLFRRALQPR